MSVKDLVAIYDSLSKLDLRVLRVVEVLHRRYEYVDYSAIIAYMGGEEHEVAESLDRLNRFRLVQRVRGAYTGYRLTFLGYDILALHTLRKRGSVTSISPTPIGVGKESDVLAGESAWGARVAVKLHRVGRVSFRNVRRLRAWLGDRRHVTWLYEARLSAQAEYVALSNAFRLGINVPEPIDVNRHAIVMRLVEDGAELARFRELENAEEVAETVLADVETAVREGGMIHGDLSGFNILVTPDGTPYIIDWPQWIPTDSPAAPEALRRDLQNLAKSFEKLGIEIDWARAYEELSKHLRPGRGEEALAEEVIRRIEAEEAGD